MATAAETGSESRGASPLIGSVLLIGMTVVLSTSIAVMAVGMVEDAKTDVFSAPDAEMEFAAAGTDMTVTHTGGEPIPAAYLYVEGDVQYAPERWDKFGYVRSGDSFTVSTTVDAEDATVKVVYTKYEDETIAAHES